MPVFTWIGFSLRLAELVVIAGLLSWIAHWVGAAFGSFWSTLTIMLSTAAFVRLTLIGLPQAEIRTPELTLLGPPSRRGPGAWPNTGSLRRNLGTSSLGLGNAEPYDRKGPFNWVSRLAELYACDVEPRARSGLVLRDGQGRTRVELKVKDQTGGEITVLDGDGRIVWTTRPGGPP